MALNATKVVLQNGGTLYQAVVGTTAPTNLGSLAVAWTEVGYMSDDGWSITRDNETFELFAYQSTDAIQTGVLRSNMELTFQLLQWDETNILFAHGGGTYTAGAVQDTFVIPTSPTLERAVLITVESSTGNLYGWYHPRMKVSAVPGVSVSGGGSGEPSAWDVTLQKLDHATLNETVILPPTGS